jgi:hypothetical protein
MKRKRLFLYPAAALLLMCLSVDAQVTEDFSDGDLTQNPSWTGDLNQFKISSSSAIPAEMRPGLQLEAADAGSSALFTEIGTEEEMEWLFWIKLSFNTSSNNHAKVYLFCDSNEVSGIQNGYYLDILN